jgi:hypothetical protein
MNTEKSGGTRYSLGKPAGWWYAPLLGLKLVAPVWEGGAKKYAPRDWAEGQSYSTLIDCAQRHWLEVLHRGPQARDEESGHLHLAHTAWNILCLLTFMYLNRDDLDDVTPWFGVKAGEQPMRDITGESLNKLAASLLEDKYNDAEFAADMDVDCHASKIDENWSIIDNQLIRREHDGAICCGECIDNPHRQCPDCPLHSSQVHWLRSVLPIEEGPGGLD